MAGVFSGCEVILDIKHLKFREKCALAATLTDNGACVTALPSESLSFYITDDKACDSFKSRAAVARGVPFVSPAFVNACVEAKSIVSVDNFLMRPRASNSADLGEGRALKDKPNESSSRSVVQSSEASLLATTRAYPFPPKQGDPKFDENSYEIAKCIVQHHASRRPDQNNLFVTELHVAISKLAGGQGGSSPQRSFRVYTHETSLGRDSAGGTQLVRYVATATAAEGLFAALRDTRLKEGFKEIPLVKPILCGSPRLRAGDFSSGGMGAAGSSVPEKVRQLLEYLYNEARDVLKELVGSNIEAPSLDAITKAEAVLLSIKNNLNVPDRGFLNRANGEKERALEELYKEYYSLIPQPLQRPINNDDRLRQQQDICQSLRDVKSLGEGVGMDGDSPIQQLYSSLGCDITHLSPSSKDFDMVRKLIDDSNNGTSSARISISNIYRVTRHAEERNMLTSPIGNRNLLFHASPVSNFLGILSRGLVVPKVISADSTIIRRDAGMLGCGIYFAPRAMDSARYAQPGSKRSRLLLVSEVALGRSMNYTLPNTTLRAPPPGYDSTHGVANSPETPSQFAHEEYVIYNTGQSRMRYLVEFYLDGEIPSKDTPASGMVNQLSNKNDAGINLPAFQKPSSSKHNVSQQDNLNLNDVYNVPDPLDSVQAGLQSNGVHIPLKAVHVRAKITDLASEVVVLQVYHNQSAEPIEAKYVFPLNEEAVVCGFEAFINGKHIVGKVKEKEKAQKEYREAIEAGHGAYLMDQESPDVFTVSVGNIPPDTECMIKITYVAELRTEGEDICFSLPGSLNPKTQSSAMNTVTQTEMSTVAMGSETTVLGACSVHVSLEMPFEVGRIHSPTHQIKLKRSDKIAYIEAVGIEGLSNGFVLNVHAPKAHSPRVWTEKDLQGHQANMLVFYPSIDTGSSTKNTSAGEIIFLLDQSCSMAEGDAFLHAQKLVMMGLKLLPAQTMFNVLGFGSKHFELFSVSRPATKANLALAEAYIAAAKPEKGATNLWQPINTLALLGGTKQSPRNVILLTDGQVRAPEALLGSSASWGEFIRLFTCGVGSSPDNHFLRTLAHACLGEHEFFDPKRKSKWEHQLRRCLHRASQPSLTDINITWMDDKGKNITVKSASSTGSLKSVFLGERLILYGFGNDVQSALLTARLGQSEFSTLVTSSSAISSRGKTLHRLTARAIIRQWESGSFSGNRLQDEIEKKATKKDIIALSIEHGVLTEFTSFVAVEERSDFATYHDKVSGSIDELIRKESIDPLTKDPFTFDLSVDASASSTSTHPQTKALELLKRGVALRNSYVTDALQAFTEGLALESETMPLVQTSVLQSLFNEKMKLLIELGMKDEARSMIKAAMAAYQVGQIQLLPTDLIFARNLHSTLAQLPPDPLEDPDEEDKVAVGAAKPSHYPPGHGQERFRTITSRDNRAQLASRSVDEVSMIMRQNIDRIIEREERLESLEDKSESLAASAEFFRKAKAVKSKGFSMGVSLDLKKRSKAMSREMDMSASIPTIGFNAPLTLFAPAAAPRSLKFADEDLEDISASISRLQDEIRDQSDTLDVQSSYVQSSYVRDGSERIKSRGGKLDEKKPQRPQTSLATGSISFSAPPPPPPPAPKSFPAPPAQRSIGAPPPPPPPPPAQTRQTFVATSTISPSISNDVQSSIGYGYALRRAGLDSSSHSSDEDDMRAGGIMLKDYEEGRFELAAARSYQKKAAYGNIFHPALLLCCPCIALYLIVDGCRKCGRHYLNKLKGQDYHEEVTHVVLDRGDAAILEGGGVRAFDALDPNPMPTHEDLRRKEIVVDVEAELWFTAPGAPLLGLLLNLGVSLGALRRQRSSFGMYVADSFPFENFREQDPRRFVLRISLRHHHPLYPTSLDGLKESRKGGAAPLCIKCNKRLWGTSDDSHSHTIAWGCSKCKDMYMCSSCSSNEWQSSSKALQASQTPEGCWNTIDGNSTGALYFYSSWSESCKWAKKLNLGPDEVHAASCTCLVLLLLRILHISSMFEPSSMRETVADMIVRADGFLRAKSTGRLQGLPYVSDSGSNWLDIGFRLLANNLSSRQRVM